MSNVLNSILANQPIKPAKKQEQNATYTFTSEGKIKPMKDKGRLYIVHLASRSAELISICSKYKLEPKRIKFIFNGDKEAYLVLIEAVKNANPGVRITKNKEHL